MSKMSFKRILNEIKDFDVSSYLNKTSDEDVKRTIKKRVLDEMDFLTLLSKDGSKNLEEIAVRAKEEHIKHFGKAVILYTPLYISNHCVNQCVYCSYNVKNKINRLKLTLAEIEKEAKVIADTGLKHILLLTGESENDTPIEYILDAIKILKKYFDSITIEIYPLNESDYKRVIDAGVDGLTIYQEVYDEKVYKEVHPYGPKSNYDFRLDAPERAAKNGIFSTNIGALLGLHNWQEEVFKLGLHVKYLQENFPDVNYSISLPRIKPFIGQEFESLLITDENLVHILLSLKLYLPSVGINLSTRESSSFRDNVLGLGVSKMSAGVSTSVGGHSDVDQGDKQFEISDCRSVDEMKEMLLTSGYQPVFKDWMQMS